VAALLSAHKEHEFYGVTRLAITLGWSEAKTRRIRTLAGVTIQTRTKQRKTGKSVAPEITAPENALKPYAQPRDESRPQDGMSYSSMTSSGAWVQDFTYLWYDRTWHYLATVLDLKTRQIVGWQFGMSHSSTLTYSALLDALSKHDPPSIVHSDQGSEYLSYKHKELCDKMEITLSCSTKASPWQNGFMERWYGNFKLELGLLTKYHDIAKLHEAIALQIHYYNTKRIHTALKMSPAAYAARLKQSSFLSAKRIDKVLQKVRG
jgi:transposase InsO family protein